MIVNNPQKLRMLTIAFLFAMGFGATHTFAQDATPTPTPESEETRRLRDEKTNAELRRDIAVAEKAETDAKFPKPSTTPLAGTTTINEGAVIESEMISYLSMAYAANRIVERLQTEPSSALKIKRLAIYNKSDIDLLLNYRATNAQLDILKQEFCKLIPEPKPEACPGTKMVAKSATAAMGIISSFLGSFVDMTALLRTNVTIQGHTFNIDEASLVSEVFRAARAKDGLCFVKGSNGACTTKPDLYYPAAFPPNNPALTTSVLLTRLEELNNLKARALAIVTGTENLLKAVVEAKAKVSRLKALKKDGPQQLMNLQASLAHLEEVKKEEEKHRRRMPFEMIERMKQLRAAIMKLEADLKGVDAEIKAAEAALAGMPNAGDEDKIRDQLGKLKLVSERFEQLIATLIKTDAATGINSLTAYLRAENLLDVMKDDGNSYWLQLAVVKAGGNNRIKTNLIVDIFTGGSRISHSGGVIVQYNLYEPNGKSIVSDTLTEYTGYTKAGRIKRLINPAKVEDTPPRKPAHP